MFIKGVVLTKLLKPKVRSWHKADYEKRDAITFESYQSICSFLWMAVNANNQNNQTFFDLYSMLQRVGCEKQACERK